MKIKIVGAHATTEYTSQDLLREARRAAASQKGTLLEYEVRVIEDGACQLITHYFANNERWQIWVRL